jgi:ribosomal protein L28
MVKLTIMRAEKRYQGKICTLCGKGIQRANLVSHAKNRVKIVRKPNLHAHKEIIGGVKVKMWLCSKCKRAIRAEKPEGGQTETETKK